MQTLAQTTLVIVGCLLGMLPCHSSTQESKAPSQANGSLPTNEASGATPTNEASDSAQANEEEVATPNEEQERVQAQVIDHDRVLIPWWEWARPCPPDAVLQGSPATGDVRCELPEGQIHGRRTQWEYTFNPGDTFPSSSKKSNEVISESEIKLMSKDSPSHAPSSD